VIEQSAIVDEIKARERVIDRSRFPKLSLQATTYGRGLGTPDTHNWGIGLSVTFPILEYKSIEARQEIERARERTESARYDQIVRELNGQLERAKAALDGARRVAANTPVQMKSARAAVEQATARYWSGLGTVVEVAEAQRLQTQTEIDDALARLNIWRAMLATAAAQGDLAPFLALAGK
jgi:outer membrane protein TolC